MHKIELQNIDFLYNSGNNTQRSVLKDISLNIEEGNFIVILGESGCGKTTLLNIISGLLPPSSGQVLINGQGISEPDPMVSFIFQTPSLLPWLNVHDNISFGCKMRGEKDSLCNKISKIVKLMGLEGFEKTYPSKLSLGMAQRVAFARALIGSPEILLLDEPFTSLDFFTRARLQVELLRIWRGQHYTVVFVTHDIDEALLVGKKIVILGSRPSRVKHIIDFDLDYPRDLGDPRVLKAKKEIQKKFKQLIDFYW